MVRHSSIFKTAVSRGFTVVELMVVVAILALLVALAGPAFTPVIERWRVRSAADDLQNSIYTARSTAIKHSGDVILKKNDTGPNGCVSSGITDFKCGWTIWWDGAVRDGNQGTCNATEQRECSVNVYYPSPNVEITVAGATNGRLYFDRKGLITNNVGVPVNIVSMEVISKHRLITDISSRKVCIAGAGRSRVIPGYDAC